MNAAEIEDLHVAFSQGEGQRTIVEGVGFTVAPGESFGLIGPSGCGKTTILRVLAGLNRNWSGRIRVGGAALHPHQKLEGQLRRDIQMVFQDPYSSLHPRHRIRHILGEPLALLGTRDVAATVERALGDVGLAPEIAARYPHQLSGGQRQRVAIARALLTQPKLLLLDEPTSALDVSVQAGILNLLNDLKAQHGMSFVLVSHDPGVIGHMCDRALLLAHGRIDRLLDRAGLADLDTAVDTPSA